MKIIRDCYRTTVLHYKYRVVACVSYWGQHLLELESLTESALVLYQISTSPFSLTKRICICLGWLCSQLVFHLPRLLQ